jgi:hypothetical protein
MLPHALFHDAGLAVMHGEAFFPKDRGRLRCETPHRALEITVAGKSKIVSVTGVDNVCGVREARETAIDAIGAEVSESRRGGRALRQMRPRVECTRFGDMLGSNSLRQCIPEATRRAIGADSAEQFRDGLRIAYGAKESGDATAVDGGEEVFEVHAQDDAFAGMGRGEGVDGSRSDEAVGGWVSGDVVKNAGEYLLLDFFEAGFGRFNEADVAGVFREDAVVIVCKRADGGG